MMEDYENKYREKALQIEAINKIIELSENNIIQGFGVYKCDCGEPTLHINFKPRKGRGQ